MKHQTDANHPEGAEDDWDFENAERRQGVKPSSVVVSVRLQRGDFDKIARKAEMAGVPTSTFLRMAALERTGGIPEATVVRWGGGAAANFNTTAFFGHTTTAAMALTPVSDNSWNSETPAI